MIYFITHDGAIHRGTMSMKIGEALCGFPPHNIEWSDPAPLSSTYTQDLAKLESFTDVSKCPVCFYVVNLVKEPKNAPQEEDASPARAEEEVQAS